MSRAYPDTGTCRHCGATVPCNRATGQTRPHPDAALANGVTPDHPCAQLPGLAPAEINEAKRHRRATPANGEPMRITCQKCGRTVGAYIPSRGDGSAARTRPHKNPNTGQRCTDRRIYDTADTIDSPRFGSKFEK